MCELLKFETSKGIRTCIHSILLRETIHIAHNVLSHFRYKQTYDRRVAEYYRLRLGAYVEEYISRCPKYSVNKLVRKKLLASLMPINIADDKTAIGAFECVGLDFIVSLPPSQGFDPVMVIVDKFTRYGTFIPTTSDYTARSTADLFV